MEHNEHEEKMFAILGKLSVVKQTIQGTPSTKEIKDNLGIINTHTGLNADEIWEAYAFSQNKCLEWGSGKKRKTVVGYKTDKS